MFGVAIAPNWPALAAAFLVAGALDAIVDVSQNAHGLRVQRQYQRSILNAFHGIWSIGAVAGGLIGSVTAGLDVPLALHLGVIAVLFSIVALLAYRAMLPGTDDSDRAEEAAAEAHRPTPTGSSARRAAVPALTALGVLAACGAFVEDAGASWSALYLRTELGAAAALAGLGFVALQVAMTVGPADRRPRRRPVRAAPRRARWAAS